MQSLAYIIKRKKEKIAELLALDYLYPCRAILEKMNAHNGCMCKIKDFIYQNESKWSDCVNSLTDEQKNVVYSILN